jgi:hypothetical protein
MTVKTLEEGQAKRPNTPATDPQEQAYQRILAGSHHQEGRINLPKTTGHDLQEQAYQRILAAKGREVALAILNRQRLRCRATMSLEWFQARSESR